MAEAETLRARAYAKINLYLHVTGRRSDGYHLLDSVVSFVNVYDEIEISPSENIILEVTGEFADDIGRASDNLIIKAANLLAARSSVKQGARIKLIKNLPPAGGIGGGSADAATTLKLLNKLWKQKFSTDELAKMSLKLGADLPMCIVGKSAHISGIGDKIEPINRLPEGYVVLVNPKTEVKSAKIYKMGMKSFSGKLKNDIKSGMSLKEMAEALKQSQNDLAMNAAMAAPNILDVLEQIRKNETRLLARMTGSGATCFGLFANEEDAAEAAEKITLHNKNWWVRSAPLIHDIDEASSLYLLHPEFSA